MISMKPFLFFRKMVRVERNVPYVFIGVNFVSKM